MSSSPESSSDNLPDSTNCIHAMLVSSFVHEASQKTVSKVIGVSPPRLMNPDAWEKISSPFLSTATATTPGMTASGIPVAASRQAMAVANFGRVDIMWLVSIRNEIRGHCGLVD